MKAWYLSTTIQGQIVASIALLVQIFGLPIEVGEVEKFVVAVLGIIGIVMSIYGRVKTKGESIGWGGN